MSAPTCGSVRPKEILAIVIASLLLTASVSTAPQFVIGPIAIALATALGLCGAPVALAITGLCWVAGLWAHGSEAAAVLLACALAPILLAATMRFQSVRARYELEAFQTEWRWREQRLLHDLRTPLNGIFGAFQLLERRDLDRRASEYVALGITSVAHMVDLIDAGEGPDSSEDATIRDRTGTRCIEIAAKASLS